MTIDEYRTRQAELARTQADALAMLAAGRAEREASRHRSLHPDQRSNSEVPENPVPPPEATGENETHQFLSESETSVDLQAQKKKVMLETAANKKKKSRLKKQKKGKKKRRVQDDLDEPIDSDESGGDTEEVQEDDRDKQEADPGGNNAPVEQGLINHNAHREFLSS